MLRGVGVLWLGQIATKGIGLATFVYLARTLGTAEYGAVEYAMGLATFTALAVDGGMGSVGTRKLAQGERTPEVLSAAVPAAQFCIAATMAPGIVVFTWLSTNDARAVTLVAWVAVSVLLLPWKQDWLFQGMGMSGHIAVGQSLRAAVLAAGVMLFVSDGADLQLVGIMEVASVGASALYLVVIQRRLIAPIRMDFEWRAMLDLGREGAAVGAAAVVWALIQYAPLMMIASMLGLVDTAHFGVAHRLAVSLVTFSWIYHFNLYPIVAQRLITDPESLVELTRASFRIAAWGGIGLALALALAAEPLLAALFGENLRPAAPIFRVLVWTFPITLLSGHARWLLVAGQRAHDMLTAQLAGGVMVVVAGTLLIGRFGTLGAATAVVLACLVIWAVAHALVTVHVRAAPLAACVLPAVLAAGILAAAKWLAIDPWLASVSGFAAFCALALLLDRALLHDLARIINAKSLVAGDPGLV